jgi:hypothetical protein
MAVQTALHFIQRLREDKGLEHQIWSLEEDPLEEIVRYGSTLGFHFTLKDLVEAHKFDWSMRWAQFSAQTAWKGHDTSSMENVKASRDR